MDGGVALCRDYVLSWTVSGASNARQFRLPNVGTTTNSRTHNLIFWFSQRVPGEPRDILCRNVAFISEKGGAVKTILDNVSLAT